MLVPEPLLPPALPAVVLFEPPLLPYEPYGLEDPPVFVWLVPPAVFPPVVPEPRFVLVAGAGCEGGGGAGCEGGGGALDPLLFFCCAWTNRGIMSKIKIANDASTMVFVALIEFIEISSLPKRIDFHPQPPVHTGTGTKA